MICATSLRPQRCGALPGSQGAMGCRRQAGPRAIQTQFENKRRQYGSQPDDCRSVRPLEARVRHHPRAAPGQACRNVIQATRRSPLARVQQVAAIAGCCIALAACTRTGSETSGEMVTTALGKCLDRAEAVFRWRYAHLRRSMAAMLHPYCSGLHFSLDCRDCISRKKTRKA